MMNKLLRTSLWMGLLFALGFYGAPVMHKRGYKATSLIEYFEAQVARFQPKLTKVPHRAIPVSLPKDQLKPFLEEHCIRCHGPKKQKGQVRLDKYSWLIDSPDHAQRWQDVLDQLNAGDMPPWDEEQPSNDELTNFISSLSDSLNDAKLRLVDHGGNTQMRRLNRREYAATMMDLFGLIITESKLPEDSDANTFDTVGEDQFFTSVDFKEYLAFARSFMPNALFWSTKKKWKLWKNHQDFGASRTERLRKRTSEDQKKLDALRDGTPYHKLGFANQGDAKQFRQQSWLYVGGPKKYLSLPHIDKGVYFTGIGSGTISYFQRFDPRGKYKFTFHGGIVGNPQEARKHLSVFSRGNKSKIVRLYGTTEKPETVEVTIQVGKDGSKAHKIHYREHYHIGNNGFHRKAIASDAPLEMEKPWASIWLDWAKVEGPHYPEDNPKITNILYPSGTISKELPSILQDDQRVKEFIRDFAFEAFRRSPAESEYIDGLHQIYLDQRAQNMDVLEALVEPMAIILSSPKFLYITEYPEADSQSISERDLAIRLSYFLWSCPPDEELYQVAASGKLSDPSILDQQIERMLADEKSKSFSQGFMSQWTEFNRFDAISISKEEFPKFNQELKNAAKQEAVEFFHTLIQENLPAQQLIDSDFVMVNGPLASHYGLKNFSSRNGGFVKVMLDPESPRGGLMTQAQFLVSGSNGERSSPVIRGAMVLDKLLHDKPPPPPPNVPELDEASDQPMSNRELVLLHQNRASCASCHKEMDVIGFGLENFDQTGAWRTHEAIGDALAPIQPGGTLPDGTQFNNINELKKALLKSEETLAKELTSSIMSYALGRTISFTDRDAITNILKSTEDHGYQVKDLVKAIAHSPRFHKAH